MSAPVMRGAEPFSSAGDDHGVLVLHGFTGNPSSMRSLAKAVAAEGYTVELPLLPGHGTAMEDMIPTRFIDWSQAALDGFEALSARCNQVAVVGLSMGGTLAAWLAVHHPEISGLVLVNPLLEPAAPALVDLLTESRRQGIEVAPGIASDIANPGVEEVGYEGTPIAAVLSLFSAVESLAPELTRVRCPVLLYSSRQDHVVASTSGDRLVAHATGRLQRIWLERSYHVATLDWDAELIEQGTVEFLRQVFDTGSRGTDRASTGSYR